MVVYTPLRPLLQSRTWHPGRHANGVHVLAASSRDVLAAYFPCSTLTHSCNIPTAGDSLLPSRSLDG